MNFNDTLASADLVLQAQQVPLLVGETGIGKSTLARTLADRHGWELITIDGNLLKEGEIGGMPTIESINKVLGDGTLVQEKVTLYAVHHKLQAIDEALAQSKEVLVFIDEINRCEHSVQQELMNLILNREINGYQLDASVKLMAAMNPENSYDYQTIDMDPAQRNRFVWLFMDVDYVQWIDWAMEAGLEPKVIEFISTYPDYLYQHNEGDMAATPRSYERISQVYRVYQQDPSAYGETVFYQVVRGNVGELVARAFVEFLKRDENPLVSYDDVFASSLEAMKARLVGESPSRLYVTTKLITRRLDRELPAYSEGAVEPSVERFIAFLEACPQDLMLGLMKELPLECPCLYSHLRAQDAFVEAYYQAVM